MTDPWAQDQSAGDQLNPPLTPGLSSMFDSEDPGGWPALCLSCARTKPRPGEVSLAWLMYGWIAQGAIGC